MSSSQKLSISSESVEKMGDEVASLLNLFNSFKMAGKSATLVLSTEGGKSTAKLEVNLSKAKSSSSPSTAASTKLLTSPGCQALGDRERPQPSAAKRARANARAAQHRVHMALPFPKGDYSAAVGPPHCSLPPPRRPLCFHPSPTCENRRRIVTVDRTAGFQPTFSQLDGDGDPPHKPTSKPSSSPSPTTSTSTLAFSQSCPPVTPPRLSRPYNHPPPLSPTADSELVRIPVNPAPSHFCCHCRTECPCIFGRPCRGCPARLGGRPHWCKRCPGSWCHNKPMNIP